MEEHDADIVIASRFLDGTKPTGARGVGQRLITALIKLTTGMTITDPTSGMRMFNRSMIEHFAKDFDIAPEPDTVFITHLKLHQSRTKVSAVTEKNFHQSRKRHVQQIDWLSLGRSLTPQRKARKGNARHADHSEYTKQKSQRRDPLPNRGA